MKYFAVAFAIFTSAIGTPTALAQNETTSFCESVVYPRPTASTTAYVNLVKRFTEKVRIDGLEVLEHLAESTSPQAPTTMSFHGLNAQDGLAFERAFRKVLAEKDLDWDAVRRELRGTIEEQRSKQRDAKRAKEETVPVLGVIELPLPPGIQRDELIQQIFVSSNGTRYLVLESQQWSYSYFRVINLTTGKRFEMPEAQRKDGQVWLFEMPDGDVRVFGISSDLVLVGYSVDSGAAVANLSLQPQIPQILAASVKYDQPVVSNLLPHLKVDGTLELFAVWHHARTEKGFDKVYDLGIVSRIDPTTKAVDFIDAGAGGYAYIAKRDGSAVYRARTTLGASDRDSRSRLTVTVEDITKPGEPILTDTYEVVAGMNPEHVAMRAVRFYSSRNSHIQMLFKSADELGIYDLERGTRQRYETRYIEDTALGFIEDRAGNVSVLMHGRYLSGTARYTAYEVSRHHTRDIIELPGNDISPLPNLVFSSDLGPLVVWNGLGDHRLRTINVLEIESGKLQTIVDEAERTDMKALTGTSDGRLEYWNHRDGGLVRRQLWGPVPSKAVGK